MTDLNQAILALQVMNGLKIYEARVVGPDSEGPYFNFRSTQPYEPDDFAIGTAKNLFPVVRILREITDFDYAEAAEYAWLVGPVPNPVPEITRLQNISLNAKKKLAQARALVDANLFLEAVGLIAEDMQLLIQKAE